MVKKHTGITLRCILIIASFLQANFTYSQEDPFKTIIDPWGRITFMLIMTNENVGINDAGSRLGLRVGRNITEGIRLFGGIELGIYLSSNDKFVLSPNNSSSTGFLNIESIKAGNVFSLRKGFIGADFGKFGTFSIGKQTAAYYDVASVTDISENNSGYASYVYTPEGSDGGSSGTGRAANSFVYKNNLGNFDFAFSGQFRLSETKFKSALNSLGGSVIYRFPFNLNAGFTVNGVFLDVSAGEKVRGLTGSPIYSAASLYYSDEHLFAGAMYAYQNNGDIATVGDSTVVYSGYGLEIAAKWMPLKKWSVLAGVNYKQPFVVDPLINSSFCRLIYFYGLQFQPIDELLLYIEGAVDHSVAADGKPYPDNISTGIKFTF